MRVVWFVTRNDSTWRVERIEHKLVVDHRELGQVLVHGGGSYLVVGVEEAEQARLDRSNPTHKIYLILLESGTAPDQVADGSHWCYRTPGVRAAFLHVGLMSFACLCRRWTRTSHNRAISIG